MFNCGILCSDSITNVLSMGRKELDMKKFLCKTVTAVLALSMLLSLGACTKKKAGSHGGRLIEKDSPWFEARTLEIDTGVDESKEKDYVYSRLVGSDEKKLVIYTEGSYKMPNDFDWEHDSYSDYTISNIAIVDRETGKTTKTIDLRDVTGDNGYASGTVYRDGKIILTVSTWDMATYEQINKKVTIDAETGEKIGEEISDRDDSTTGVFDVGDYQIEAAANWNTMDTYFNLYVTGPDGQEKKVELKAAKGSIFSIDAIIPLDETTALIPASAEIGYDFYELDLKTCEITKVESKEYDWLDDISLYYMFVGSDGNLYSSSPAGISRIDMENQTTEEVFNYSWCGMSRNVLINLMIGDITEDSFLLYGEEYTSNPFTQNYDWNNSKFQIIEFTKADTNPHAGKRVLELYTSYGYTDDVMSEAISEYNETNDKYFIEVTDRYTSNVSYDYSDIKSDDEASLLNYDYDTQMGNKLAMDIINGDGPDMFLDVSYLNQLSNDDYLVDLTPYVGKLDEDKYFTNIIDLAKVDGKLYNLPVCFGINGILTDSKYAGSSGIGFTTDEYIDFVSGPLNGTDVITNGQALYFATLFSTMRGEFIKNGKVDLTGPEFAFLAEYVKDNVPESSATWESEMEGFIVYSDDMFEETNTAIYTTSGGFADYFLSLQQLESGDAILGLPSVDGRGPMASPYSSIAISSQAYDVDACGEFVKLLLSDEIQSKYAERGNFVLNREIFRQTGEEAVEYFNKTSISNIYGFYSENAPANRVKYTTEHIDLLENTVLNCSAMCTEDAEVNMVLIEEMPSYFSGQKSLDEVIEIAQDRIQKILDERG